MKWSWVGVIVMGLVAAFCMAGIVMFLPNYIRGPVAKTTSQIDVVVAAKDLASMKIVDANSVKTVKVAKAEAPEDRLSSELQAIGHVLARPVVAGQPLTDKCFISEGSGAHLASALPKGMRAMGVLLPEDCGLFGLLYPGCLVDVFTSHRLSGSNAESESDLLLQNVSVLAVEAHSIVSKEESGQLVSNKLNNSQKRMVTLMVEPEQARQLQAATQQGAISLAMRNPTDETRSVATRKTKNTLPKAEQPEWDMIIQRGSKIDTIKFKLNPQSSAGMGTFGNLWAGLGLAKD